MRVSTQALARHLSELVAVAWPSFTTDEQLEQLAGLVAAVATGERPGPLWDGARTLPYALDAKAQRVVNYLAPCTLEQVGAVLGITRERVRQLEEGKLRVFRRRAELRAARGAL